jgi:hypothetical protein
MAAAASHYGEIHVRQRFVDYITRFLRLAAHHEYTQTGETKIGHPSQPYIEGRLGSGAVFADESHKSREMACNATRIDVWKHTRGYQLAVEVSPPFILLLMTGLGETYSGETYQV